MRKYKNERKRLTFSFDVDDAFNEEKFQRFLTNTVDEFTTSFKNPIFNYEFKEERIIDKDGFKPCKDKLFVVSLDGFMEEDKYERGVTLEKILNGEIDISEDVYYVHEYHFGLSKYGVKSNRENRYHTLCDYQSSRNYNIYLGDKNAALINLKEQGKLVCNITGEENEVLLINKQSMILDILKYILNMDVIICTCKIKQVGEYSYAVRPSKMINPFRFVCSNLKLLPYKSKFELVKYTFSHASYLMSSLISEDLFKEDFKWYNKFCSMISKSLKEGISDEIKRLETYSSEMFSKSTEKREAMSKYLNYLHVAICNYKALYLHEMMPHSLSSSTEDIFKRVMQTREECIEYINNIKSSFKQFPNNTILSYLFSVVGKSMDYHLISDNPSINNRNDEDICLYSYFFKGNNLIQYDALNIYRNMLDYHYMNFSLCLNEITEEDYNEKILWKVKSPEEHLDLQKYYFQNYLTNEQNFHLLLRSDEELLYELGIISKKFLPEFKDDPKEYTNKEMIRTWLVHNLILPNYSSMLSSEKYYESIIVYTMYYIIRNVFLKCHHSNNFKMEVYNDNKDIFDECIRLYGINSIGFNMLKEMCNFLVRESVMDGTTIQEGYETNHLKILDDYVNLYLDKIENCQFFISTKAFINFDGFIKDVRNPSEDVRMRVIKDQGKYKKMNKIVLDETIKQKKLSWRV